MSTRLAASEGGRGRAAQREPRLSRRSFLLSSGALVVSLSVGAILERPRARAGRRAPGPYPDPDFLQARHLDRDPPGQHRDVLRRQDGRRPGHGHRVPPDDVRRARHRVRQDAASSWAARISRRTRAAPAAPTRSSATAGPRAASPPKRGACCSSSAPSACSVPVRALAVQQRRRSPLKADPEEVGDLRRAGRRQALQRRAHRAQRRRHDRHGEREARAGAAHRSASRSRATTFPARSTAR